MKAFTTSTSTKRNSTMVSQLKVKKEKVIKLLRPSLLLGWIAFNMLLSIIVRVNSDVQKIESNLIIGTTQSQANLYIPFFQR